MNDIQLTRHFMLSEFIKSDTANKLNIANIPDLDQVSNLQYLCREVLEPLREWMNEPITISSGFRCPKLNKAVGGATNSQHLSGEAADIHLPSIEVGRKYLDFILDNCRFDVVIWEHDSSGNYWIHVSIKQEACGEQGRTSKNRQKYIPNLLKQ